MRGMLRRVARQFALSVRRRMPFGGVQQSRTDTRLLLHRVDAKLSEVADFGTIVPDGSLAPIVVTHRSDETSVFVCHPADGGACDSPPRNVRALIHGGVVQAYLSQRAVRAMKQRGERLVRFALLV